LLATIVILMHCFASLAGIEYRSALGSLCGLLQDSRDVSELGV